MSSEAAWLAWYQATFDYAHPNPVGKGAGTPYYRYWEIGVAVPINNAHFCYPKKIRETILSSVAIGANTFTIRKDTTANATILKNYLTNLGIGQLFKADQSDNESFEIASITQSTTDLIFVIYGTFTKAFSANDVFICYSSTMIDNWDVKNSLIVPTSLVKGFPVNYNDIDGKIRAQQLSIILSDITSDKKYFETSLTTDIYRFIKSNYTYRIGARYYIGWRSSNDDAGKVTLSTYNGATFDISLDSNVYTSEEMINLSYWFDNSAIDTSELKHKYYVFNKVISNTIDSTNIRDGARKLKLGIKLTGSSILVNNHVIIGLEDIYWEHSGGVESSLGCVLLPNAPNRDSIKIGYIEEDLIIDRGSNNDGFLSFPRGNPNTNRKYTLTCTFTDVPLGIFNKLKIMEMFQNDGYLINIHPHFNELPQVLTGYLKITNVRKNGTMFGLTTFDLYFEEV